MADEYILSLSYGKDSLACLGAIEQLGLPLTRIVHAEVWATQDIPADLPPMVEFKKKADKIIKERWGIDVEHVCATKPRSQIANEREREGESSGESHSRLSYEDMFYRVLESGKFIGAIKGFPMQRGSWCKKLKIDYCAEAYLRGHLLSPNQTEQIKDCPERENLRIPDAEGKLVYGTKTKVFSNKPVNDGQKINIVQYLGIAADEPERIKRHSVPGKMLPLVEIGWDEAHCRKWCEDNDLLSPIYTTAARGGCWFCHNQSVEQLRLLRRTYPDLWKLLLKWDSDSPVTFHADGHTVHDFDARFALEDSGVVKPADRWLWEYLNHPPYQQLNLIDMCEVI